MTIVRNSIQTKYVLEQMEVGELFVIDKGNRNQKYGVVPAIGDKDDYIELGDTFEKIYGTSQ